MLSGLILTAFLMGLGGVPHCAAMCGAACAVALPKGVPLSSLLGRCLAYALLGSVAAASAGIAARWGRQFAFVQPLWILAQAVAVLLGIYLALSGQMPRQIDAWGQHLYRRCQARWSRRNADRPQPSWQRALWPLLAGMAWAILPCGLLYAAVMVAVLATSAWGGALIMLAFALPSAWGVWAAPMLLRRLLKRGASATLTSSPSTGAGAVLAPVIWLQPESALPNEGTNCDEPQVPPSWRDPRWAVRLAGLMLAVMGSWALYHQVLAQWRAWCA
ncbi:MAG: sulfite exporter TauE/SafE family protein [Aquabacterium sp.]